MKQYYSILLTLLSILPAPALLCQSRVDSDCKQLIKKVYRDLEDRYTQPDNGVFQWGYTTKIKMQEEDSWSVTNVSLFATAEKSFLISEQVEVYEDKRTTVSVIPSNKAIYIHDSTPGIQKKERIRQLTSFQDSLLLYSRVGNCQDMAGNRKKVELILNDTGKKIFNADKAIFILDIKKSTVVQTEMKYLPSHRMSQMIIVFHEDKKNYNANITDSSALGMVFGANGKLKDQYKGYKIYDSRKRTP